MAANHGSLRSPVCENLEFIPSIGFPPPLRLFAYDVHKILGFSDPSPCSPVIVTHLIRTIICFEANPLPLSLDVICECPLSLPPPSPLLVLVERDLTAKPRDL